MTSTPAIGTLRATHLRVLLADEDEEALERLGDVLAALGHEVCRSPSRWRRRPT